jgi:soluble lytic murein transglycosylase
MMLRKTALAAIVCVAVILCPAHPGSTAAVTPPTPASPAPNELWLAPEPDQVIARGVLARAVADFSDGRPQQALAALERWSSDPVLGGYALLYLGRAQLSLDGKRDAFATARRLLGLTPTGYLQEAAWMLMADAAAAAGQPAAALTALQSLADQPGTQSVAGIELKRGRAAIAAGDRATAIRALSRVYFDYPLAPEAAEAQTVLAGASAAAVRPTRESLAFFLGRAERLFAGRQYADARSAFDTLKLVAAGDDLDLATLRIAECDYYLKRYAASLTSLAARSRAASEKSFTDAMLARGAEAEYFVLGDMRELGDKDYEARLQSYVDRGDDPIFAERALMDLAQFHTLANDDAKAAAVFAESYRRFPQGALAERAAWKAGWWAYRTADYATAVRIFDSAAAGMRRADTRPAWLYWAARARANQAQTESALAAYARAIADYRNTYYGRAAIRDTEAIQAAMRPAGAGPVSPASLSFPATVSGGARPDNASLIEALLSAGMYDDAIGELKYAQNVAGSSPLIEATIAMALNRQGRLRPAITAMRRAYPQFLAAGGEALPPEIQTVIFPVDHWDAITQHAREKDIDRYLLAALIAQESTFQADIKSAANAWGLMQILPSTGRQYATKLGIRPFSTTRLIDPDVNLQIGTTYFAELLERFGDAAPALAAYNAGPSRAAKWLAERPGLPREEFIDDIPYPETQNYVKRILGTAEDYRRLYR